jgi:arylsulfatase A-like enzyme
MGKWRVVPLRPPAPRPLARLLVRSALAGALTLAALFALDLSGANLDFMGVSDPKAVRRIFSEYGRAIARDELAILALYLVVGAALGAAGGALLALRDRARLRTGGRGRALAAGAGAALTGHLLLFVVSLHRYPQLYGEALYDHGGWRGAATMLATDHVRPVWVAGVALALVLLAIPWPFLARTLYRGSRAGALPSERAMARQVIGALVAVAALSATLALTRGTRAASAAPGAGGARPNVLLIAVDSLRADRVFGAGAARFPTLRGLAERGVRFREAHVTVPRTFPSFVTLLTGRYPHHHGIRHMFPSARQRADIGPTLPAQLHASGYRTAVVGDYAAEIFSRTPLGFDDVDAPRFDMRAIVQERALQLHPNALAYAALPLFARLFPAVRALPERSDPELLADRAIAELRRLADRPFFLTLFFSAAHFPYAAPAPYYARFADPAYRGPFRYEKPPLATATVGPADAAQIRALYDGAVLAVDAALARVLAELERLRLDGDTIVVLLADHGENLYDVPGRGMGHGDHLNGSAADHVPLVVIDPLHRLGPRDVPGIVRDVDLAPTLTRLLEVGPLASDGEDLRPLLRGEKSTLGLAAFSETEFWFTANGPGFQPDERLPYPGVTGATDLAADGDVFLRPEWQDMVTVAKHRAIRTERWRLVYQPTPTGVRYRLYDLAADRDELTDVAAAHPEVVDELRARLIAWMTSDGRTEMRGGYAVPR